MHLGASDIDATRNTILPAAQRIEGIEQIHRIHEFLATVTGSPIHLTCLFSFNRARFALRLLYRLADGFTTLYRCRAQFRPKHLADVREFHRLDQ